MELLPLHPKGVVVGHGGVANDASTGRCCMVLHLVLPPTVTSRRCGMHHGAVHSGIQWEFLEKQSTRGQEGNNVR